MTANILHVLMPHTYDHSNASHKRRATDRVNEAMHNADRSSTKDWVMHHFDPGTRAAEFRAA